MKALYIEFKNGSYLKTDLTFREKALFLFELHLKHNISNEDRLNPNFCYDLFLLSLNYANALFVHKCMETGFGFLKPEDLHDYHIVIDICHKYTSLNRLINFDYLDSDNSNQLLIDHAKTYIQDISLMYINDDQNSSYKYYIFDGASYE